MYLYILEKKKEQFSNKKINMKVRASVRKICLRSFSMGNKSFKDK